MQLDELHLQKAAERGEPSHVWRAGQQRRLNMIREAAGERLNGKVFVDGCGLGAYLEKLAPFANPAIGLDIEHERTVEARQKVPRVVCGAGEFLPFPANSFDLILSHEVLEHVQDDQAAIREMVRTLTPGGRLVLFCPNRGYPFETHGMYWRGKYHFGNIPLINYLPRSWRDKLAPHVEVYTRRDLERLVRRPAGEIRLTPHHFWRLRQHYRPFAVAWQPVAPLFAVVGTHPPARAGPLARVGGRENLNVG